LSTPSGSIDGNVFSKMENQVEREYGAQRKENENKIRMDRYVSLPGIEYDVGLTDEMTGLTNDDSMLCDNCQVDYDEELRNCIASVANWCKCHSKFL